MWQVEIKSPPPPVKDKVSLTSFMCVLDFGKWKANHECRESDFSGELKKYNLNRKVVIYGYILQGVSSD